MRNILILSLVLLVSCKPKQILQTVVKDSIVYRTIEREVIRIDTVTINLPQVEKQVIKQDSSFIETKYSTSKAVILKSGLLYHNLINKPLQLIEQVNVIDRVVYKDSIVFQTKIEQVAIKKPLTKLQRFLFYSGIALWLILIFVIVKKVNSFV